MPLKKLRVKSRRRNPVDAFDALIALLPRPWSADQFVEQVSRSRTRPISLITLPIPERQASGYWLPWADRDVVVVPDSAVGARRDAIVCHELAHIVLEHEPLLANDVEDLGILAPNLSPELVARFLPRHGYEARIEREAETLATRLIAYIDVHSGDSPGRSDTEHDRISDRLR